MYLQGCWNDWDFRWVRCFPAIGYLLPILPILFFEVGNPEDVLKNALITTRKMHFDLVLSKPHT